MTSENVNKITSIEHAYKIVDVAVEDQDADYDTCFCIVGKERVGKSNLLLHIMDYLGRDIEDICLEGSDFMKRLYNVEEAGVVALDEAGDSMFSRDAMTSQTKQFVKLYQAIGGKRLITFLVLPQFFMLDKYFRETRVDSLFYVYARGRYVFYSPSRLKKILQDGKIPMPPRNSYRRKYYPKYEGRLLEPYQKLKRKKIQEILKKAQPKDDKKDIPVRDKIILQMTEEGFIQKDIGRAVGLTQERISQIQKQYINYKQG